MQPMGKIQILYKDLKCKVPIVNHVLFTFNMRFYFGLCVYFVLLGMGDLKRFRAN